MAVTITASEVATAIGATEAVAERLLPVARALVERYAPAAPEDIQNEAAARCAGWLKDSPASGLYESQRGERGFTLARPHSLGALRSSGAMALLSPWKVRRAGAI